MTRGKLNHNQGDAGTKPPDGEDFQNGEIAEPQYFDWLFDSVPTVVDGHADEFTRLDGDNDGVVDSADYANDADASTYKGNDIDADGDGQVDSADSADDATNVTSTYKGNDIDSNADGKVDAADSADTASAYKGNDVDSNGDGVVDEADSANAYKNNDIDSDGDGVVDSADYANDADASAYKGNDIDSNGDGKVDSADDADNVSGTYKGNDIDSNGDGIVDEADSAVTYKGNDIDSDGDGKVNAAEQADNADTLDGEHASAFADAGDVFTASSPTDETSNRSFNTQYTNNTGGPIWVHANGERGSNGDAYISLQLVVDGVTVSYDSDDSQVIIGVSGIVPDGSTYEVQGDDSFNDLRGWTEQELTP